MIRILIFLLCVFLSTSAQAQEGNRDLYREVAAFAKNLSPDQTRHFYLLYNNYNLIRTVEVVRGDVSKAVDSCSDNNPAMEDKMRGAFKNWSDEVDPALGGAKSKLEQMVSTQNYANPKEIIHIFGLVDGMREKAGSDFSKVPVSTPEACDYLLVKMDDTEEGLLDLLNATLIEYPQSLPAAGDAAPEASTLVIEQPKKANN